jgi:hypothetical protein
MNEAELVETNGHASGVERCSKFTEDGIYFGKDGGYVIISPQFVVTIF